MNSDRSGIQAGWDVVASDGKKVGTVKAVREDHLVVEQGRLMKHNLFIPIDHIAPADDGAVTVTVPSGEVDHQGWRVPPTATHEHGSTPYPEVPQTTMIQTAGYSAGTLSAPEAQGYAEEGVESDDDQIPNALHNPEGTDRPGSQGRDEL